MSESSVSKRYAKALFELAVERECVNEISKDLASVAKVLSSSPELVQWLLHPISDVTRKKELFAELFKKVQPTTLHFLFVVLDHHREGMMQEMISDFSGLVNEEKGELQVVVTSAFPLGKSDKKHLLETFRGLLNKKISISQEIVDTDLLGGVVVQVGDRIYDSSLKTKLIRFGEQMKRMRVGS